MLSPIPGISQSISRNTSRQRACFVTPARSKARRPLHLFALMIVMLAAWKPLSAQLVQVNRISTIAGTPGQQGTSGDGGKATSALLQDPINVAVDRAGNTFIADTANGTIRKVNASTGIITIFAGNGTSGFSGDGGPATSAQLTEPEAVALDSAGNLYIADEGNSRIRLVKAGTGIISTVGGNGSQTSSGDGGAATSAGISQPTGVALDSAGNIYVLDFAELGVRKINASTGIITTVISNASAPSPGFLHPFTLAVDSFNNIFISDSENHEVFKLTAATGTLSVYAGNGTAGSSGDGGPASSAELNFPEAVAVDDAGNLYITDENNTIRKVSAATGVISTIAGSVGPIGFSGDGGPAINAKLGFPMGAAVDGAGNFYFVDSRNDVVRELSPLSFPDTNVGSSSTPENLFLQTTAAETITSFTVPVSQGNKQEYTVGMVTGCAVDGTTSNPAGTICTIPITFSPAYPGVRPVPLQAVTSAGKINIGLGGKGVGPLIAFAPGILSTLAGTSPNGNGLAPAGDGGPATAASFFDPQGVAVDYAGNIYVADAGAGGGAIRRIDATTGIISGFAGEGRDGGDGGLAVNASLAATDVVLDSAGNFYMTDNSAQSVRIRRVDGATNIISTVAGASDIFADPPPTPQPSNGDGGPATQSILGILSGVAMDRQGKNLYFTDSLLNQVRKVDLTTGIISTFAGTGTKGYTGDGGPATSATLDSPEGIAVDSTGNVYFADDLNGSVDDHVVRRVDALTGIITTYAGDPSAPYTYNSNVSYYPGEFPTGPATSINIEAKYLKFDSAGNLYITGLDAVRRVDAATKTISAIASTVSLVSYAPGYIQPTGKPALGWLANSANGIALDNVGNLYITSPSYLQKIDVSTSIFSFPTLTQVDTLDTTDGPQPVNVANIGNAALTLAAPTTGTDPALSPASYIFDAAAGNPCPQVNAGSSPATIAPGNSCAITLDFEPLVGPTPPASELTIPGSVVLTDNSLNIPTSAQTIPVTGRSFGVASGPQPMLTPATMNFASLTVGTTSAAQTATLSNTGSAALTITSFGFFGANTSSFGETTTCGSTLAAGASCSIAITCKPSAAGSLTANLGANFPSPLPQQSVALTCMGTAATAPPAAPQAALTPASVNFNSVATGSSSTAQTFTLANAGNAALAISSINLGGANASVFALASNTCGTSLAAGASCTISVTFTPVAAGSVMATLTVADNAAGSPQISSLTGTGTSAAPPATADFTVTATPASQAVASGSSAAYSVNVASTAGTFTQAVTLSASGLPPGATASFSPATVTPGGSGAQSTMTIQTGSLRASSSGGSPSRPFAAPLLAVALLILPFRTRKRIFRGLACALMLMGIAGTLTGCGGGFALPESNSTTYTIPVTGTSGSDIHSTTVTLTVK